MCFPGVYLGVIPGKRSVTRNPFPVRFTCQWMPDLGPA